MATTAPVVEWADCATARARQAAIIPEICSAFPAVIERRPKILRLGDKSGPFLFAVNCRSRDYRKRISVSQRSIAVTTAGLVLRRKRDNSYMWQSRFRRSPVILEEWSATRKLNRRFRLRSYSTSRNTLCWASYPKNIAGRAPLSKSKPRTRSPLTRFDLRRPTLNYLFRNHRPLAPRLSLCPVVVS